VFVWDARTGAERLRLRGLHDAAGFVYALAFSPDGRLLARAGPENRVCLWDLARPTRPARALLGPGVLTTGVTFSPDGRRLAAAGYDGRVKLWTRHRATSC
jgi:WD40 repeat protein